MGISSRTFLLDQKDTLHRLASRRFEQILRDPASHRFPRFAGNRVRVANVLVELLHRRPIRVILTTFGIFTFDSEGCLDSSTYERQQWARAELALAPARSEPESNVTVIDAASRFVALGGNWTPSRTLARTINDTALGRLECFRL